MDIDYNMPVGNMQTFYERKLSKFLIMFDNSNLLYFPGQFLSGRVIVELQDEMAITGTELLRNQIFCFLLFIFLKKPPLVTLIRASPLQSGSEPGRRQASPPG